MRKTNKATPSRLYKKVNARVPVEKKVYLELYKRFALQVKEELLDGHDWVTNKFGMIGMRGVQIDPNNRPVNWKVTKELWESCPECKEKKQLVRFLNNYLYRAQWYKQKGANTPSLTCYWFKQAETFSDDLTIRIRQGQEYYESEKTKHKKRFKQT